MSLVSIIIPCYNTGHYVAEAIESCLAQTYRQYEIIVVNDGSTDQTERVARSYPQVSCISQENRGIAGARNTGIRASRGEFVQFLDADDILLPAKIERCLAHFSRFPEAGLVYTDYECRSHDLTGILPRERLPYMPEGLVARDLINVTSSFFAPHCALVRREALETVGGFNESLRAVEDWHFWVCLAARGVIFRYIDEVLAWYRNTPQSVSKDEMKMACYRLKAMEALRGMPLPPDIDLEEKIAARHHLLAHKYWQRGRKAEARQHFQAAIAVYPRKTGMRRLLLAMTYIARASAAEALLRILLRLRGR